MTAASELMRQIGTALRQARLTKGVTLRALAEKTGLSSALLSRLERGQVATSIANLIAIASVLGVNVSDLFDVERQQAARDGYVVVRAQDRTTPKEIVATGYRYEPLVTGWHGQRVDAFILTFPLQNRADVLTAHDGEELLYVLQGQIAFRLGSQDIPLKAGDCIYFRSEIPHMGKNVGTVDARVLMVTSPGRGPGRELGWWNATPVPGRSPRRAKTSRVGQKRR